MDDKSQSKDVCVSRSFSRKDFSIKAEVEMQPGPFTHRPQEGFRELYEA